MYIKVTQSGPRRYVQLVESYRDEHGRPRQRTLASLGRLEKLDAHMDSVVAGLLRATGRQAHALSPAESSDEPTVSFATARAIGDVWALTELWHELGFDTLGKIFRRQPASGFT